MLEIEFLSKTKITDDFLKEVIVQLNLEKNKKWLPEESKVLDTILKDLESKGNSKSFSFDSEKFILHENEYNYLSQNKKSMWTEYLIQRYKFKIYPVLKKLTDFPTYLHIEPVSYCNLRCPKCFQADSTFTKPAYMGYMDVNLFKKIIDEAVDAGCKFLTMASRGEPLLHPKFGKIMEYTKGKFFDLKLDTNAMPITEEKSHQLLQNGVTELVFSVDTFDKDEYKKITKHGDFERVVKNIKRFHEIRRREYPKSKCKTRVSAVLYTDDFNVKNFLKFWGAIVDHVACVPLLKKCNIYSSKVSKKRSPCNLLWNGIFVWFDGIVNPCDEDYKSYLGMGNVKESSIRDIWTGEKFTRLRDAHLKGRRQSYIPCNRCDY